MLKETAENAVRAQVTRRVLILILMEHAQRAVGSNLKNAFYIVLILILMEHAQRATWSKSKESYITS